MRRLLLCLPIIAFVVLGSGSEASAQPSDANSCVSMIWNIAENFRFPQDCARNSWGLIALETYLQNCHDIPDNITYDSAFAMFGQCVLGNSAGRNFD